MYKKILFTLFFSFSLICVNTTNSHAAMNSKMKVMATMAVYGAGSGALLGFASMAFGTRAKTIAQGASLGLYAGLVFGVYLIASYEYKQSASRGDYPVSNPTYENGDFGGGAGESDMPLMDDDGGGDGGAYQYWNGIKTRKDKLSTRFLNGNKQKEYPDFYINLVNIRF